MCFLFFVLVLCFSNVVNAEPLVDAKIDGVVCDLLYAKKDNFTKSAIYKNSDSCFLHKDAIEKLKIAASIATKLGYRIKITDAFRPIEVQQILWNFHPDENFVSNPSDKNKALGHCRGAAVDATLITANGKELAMGTSIDYFGNKAYRANIEIGAEELKNRMMFIGIMAAAGFEPLQTEWWHFNLPDLLSYPIIDDGLKYVPILPQVQTK